MALGLLSHAVLRLRGSPRTLRGSLALSLYVGGGPGALVTVLNISLFVIARLVWGKSDFRGAEILSASVMTLAVLVFATRLGFMVIFVRALSGFHAARTGWTLAFLLTLTTTALAFGLLDPPGTYGGHFVIGRLDEGERVWWPTYAF